MNITVIRLVIVATSTGFVVMCKILTVVVTFFLNARVNIYFPWPRLTTAYLDMQYHGLAIQGCSQDYIKGVLRPADPRLNTDTNSPPGKTFGHHR